MGLLEDIKAKADLNGDGKLSREDLDSLQTDQNKEVIDQLKTKADQNGDGKLNFDDLKGFDVSNISDQVRHTVDDLKKRLFE